jgi:hypothetical protein
MGIKVICGLFEITHFNPEKSRAKLPFLYITIFTILIAFLFGIHIICIYLYKSSLFEDCQLCIVFFFLFYAKLLILSSSFLTIHYCMYFAILGRHPKLSLAEFSCIPTTVLRRQGQSIVFETTLEEELLWSQLAKL